MYTYLVHVDLENIVQIITLWAKRSLCKQVIGVAKQDFLIKSILFSNIIKTSFLYQASVFGPLIVLFYITRRMFSWDLLVYFPDVLTYQP